VPAQRGVVRVDPAEEPADLLLGIAHARLERLGDHVEQPPPPRLAGRHGRDLAVADEHPELGIAGQRGEHGRGI
jgi:hypothetical protein